jgi:hypothetical protein
MQLAKITKKLKHLFVFHFDISGIDFKEEHP